MLDAELGTPPPPFVGLPVTVDADASLIDDRYSESNKISGNSAQPPRGLRTRNARLSFIKSIVKSDRLARWGLT